MVGREVVGLLPPEAARAPAARRGRRARDQRPRRARRRSARALVGALRRTDRRRRAARRSSPVTSREIMDGARPAGAGRARSRRAARRGGAALISAAARRVSVVTAVSPRAFVDVAFVLWECLRLIRRISALYGGRPGTLGLLRLTQAVLGHLAVTGTHRGRRHDPAADPRPRPRRPALRPARRGRRQRPDDGADRAFGDGRLPAAAVHPR